MASRRSTFGTARKLPSGRYQASYWYEGRRHLAEGTFDSKADADAWLASARTDIGRGAWIDPDAGKVTLRDYADGWLAERHDLSERTAELYRHVLDRHVYATLGDLRLGELKPSVVRSWHAKVAEAHPATAAKAYRLLSTVMRTAVTDRQIVVSPCQVKGGGVEKAPERPIASIPEVEAAAAAMPKHLRIAVLLAAWCQLRRAELLGLRRRDVDLLRRTLTIATTRTVGMNGKEIKKAPKTDVLSLRNCSSERSIYRKLPIRFRDIGTTRGCLWLRTARKPCDLGGARTLYAGSPLGSSSEMRL